MGTFDLFTILTFTGQPCFLLHIRRYRHMRISKRRSICQRFLLILVLLGFIPFVVRKCSLALEYRHARHFYLEQVDDNCQSEYQSVPSNGTKTILFWTKIFSDSVKSNELNSFIASNCNIKQCRVTTNRDELCRSAAVIFHARSTDQRTSVQDYGNYRTSGFIFQLDSDGELSWLIDVDRLVVLVSSRLRH
jgi:hypothetical protein